MNEIDVLFDIEYEEFLHAYLIYIFYQIHYKNINNDLFDRLLIMIEDN